MAKKAKIGLTPEQYNSLTHQGKELHDYWREWNRKLYNQAVTDGDLYELVSTMGRQMQDQMDQLMQQMAETAGITEELKAHDPMRWVGEMNAIKAQAEEMIFEELIYS